MTVELAAPSRTHCVSCDTRLLPDFAWTNWLWGKRCQMCRARYCRACVRRYVRTTAEEAPLALLHENAHAALRRVDLDDATITAPLGRFDPKARYGTLRPQLGGFVVNGEVFATVEEAAADTFARYVLTPEQLTIAQRRWVERIADRFDLTWTELASEMRSAAQPGGDAFYGAHTCGYCGHRWGEVSMPSV